MAALLGSPARAVAPALASGKQLAHGDGVEVAVGDGCQGIGLVGLMGLIGPMGDLGRNSVVFFMVL